jgi:staphylococcal nuclease domain-containing protein 1
LLSAESRAQKKGLGIHSSKEPITLKIADISSDVNKAKQFLPFLQRAGRMEALVEFVASGSRLKLYIPKETCLVTLLLGGIDCPRIGRPAIGSNSAQQADEFGEEAYLYTKSQCLQREVQIEIDSVDKGGNFIGQLFSDGLNLSAGLVESGYAAVYKNVGSNSAYYSILNNAETKAKEKKLNRWKNYVEEKIVIEEQEKNEPQERVVNQKKIVITEITNELHFYGQLVENGAKLEQLTIQLRAELEARPPVPGSYTPKLGEICVAKFSLDGEWYRAKIISLQTNGDVIVLFIDYGNKEQTQTTKLAQIPAGFEALPPQANEYSLSLVQLSTDEDDNEVAVEKFKEIANEENDAEFSINIEYKSGSVEYVTLCDSKKNDIGKMLINNGFVSVDKTRRERRLQKMLTEYLKALAIAKQSHKNMWRYGDKEQDDAAEFGITRR